jgi:hypothetical protein
MQLNEQRKAFLIKYFALKEPYHKIKNDYQKTFDDKTTAEELMEFETLNYKNIQHFAKRELNDIKQEPLAHPRIRLRILNDMLTYAMTPRATKSVPIRSDGKNIEYDITYEPDYRAVDALIKTAQNEEFFIKKFLLEIKKIEINPIDLGTNGESGFDVIQIDDGLKQLENH